MSPVVNRLLPSVLETIRLYALALIREGKERLRSMLAISLSDIYITYNIWTLLNNLGILAVVAYFTSEKSQLLTVTLVLVKL